MPALRVPNPPLTDGVVTLRAWRDDDVPAIVAACRDGEVTRWTRVPSAYGEEDARLWLAGHDEDRRHGRRLPLAVADADDNRVLGSIGLVAADHEDRWAEVGYWVAPWARRRGVATRALRLLSRWALDDLGFARVVLKAAVGNVASQRVAERAGFRFEGVLRSHLQLRGVRHDAVVFGLLPGDLTELTAGRR